MGQLTTCKNVYVCSVTSNVSLKTTRYYFTLHYLQNIVIFWALWVCETRTGFGAIAWTEGIDQLGNVHSLIKLSTSIDNILMVGGWRYFTRENLTQKITCGKIWYQANFPEIIVSIDSWMCCLICWWYIVIYFVIFISSWLSS